MNDPPRAVAAASRGPLGPWTFGLLAAIPALALLAAERYVFGGEWGFPLDDSWIHLVFARALAAGEGLAFNPGALVAGTTAPLWTALLGLLYLLPGSPLLWAKLAGVALHALSAAATRSLALRLGLSPRRAVLAGALVALSSWLVWSSISGMEVSLATYLIVAGLARHLDERARPALPPLSLLLFGLAALARPEALLLPLLATLDRVLRFARRGDALELDLRQIRDALFGLFVAALVIVSVGLAFLKIWGSPLPTTFSAKSSGPPVWIPELRFLRGVLGLLFAAQPWFVLLAFGGLVESIRRLGTARDRGLLLPLWTFGMPLAAAAMSSGQEIAVGNFGRYFFPLQPTLILLGLLALDRVAWSSWREVRWRGVPLPAGVLALLLLVAPGLGDFAAVFGRYLQARENVEASDVAASRWLAPRLSPEAVLAVNDVGAIKYLLPNRVVDLVGIVTPELIPLRRAGVRAGRDYVAVLADYLERARPDFVLVFPDWFTAPARAPERFQPLRVFRVEHNVAMGGEMMVLYDTPWTRRPLAPEGTDRP